MAITRKNVEHLIIQGHNEGRTRWIPVGTGRHGIIRLTFSHPEAPNKIVAIDQNTGETHFLPAQRAERRTGGRIRASDFPSIPRTQATGIDRAAVASAQFENVRGSARENWPLEQKGQPNDEVLRLRKLASGGFHTNIGKRYERRLGAHARLQQMRERRKARIQAQQVDDGVKF